MMFALKRKMLVVVAAAASLIGYVASAQGLSYDYNNFVWMAGKWVFVGTGKVVNAPDNTDLRSSAALNFGTPAPDDSWGGALSSSSPTTLYTFHTYGPPDNSLTYYDHTGSISGDPGSDWTAIGALNTKNPAYISYLYAYDERQDHRLNVFQDMTGNGNYQYVAVEPIVGDPGSNWNEFDMLHNEDDQSFLYAVDADSANKRLNVFHWSKAAQAGIWSYVGFEPIFGDPGNSDWTNYSMLSDGYHSYLSVKIDGGLPPGNGGGTPPGNEIPEPSTAALFLAGLGGLARFRKRLS